MMVVPLTQVSPDDLSAVLAEEICCWRNQLFWDYSSSATLIRKYVSFRSLPGFVLKRNEQEVCGYSYYIADASIAYIGNLFVSSAAAQEKTYRVLLEAVLQQLIQKLGMKRIESQVFGFNFDFSPIFVEHDFRLFARSFLLLDLIETDLPALPILPEGIQLEHWRSDHFVAAAEVISNSYQGSLEALMCRDYQSREGCRRFLKNLIDNPGCGIFDKRLSQLARNSNGEVCAVLLASRIGEETAMLPQISVRPEFQGRGLGRLLLTNYLCEARRERLRRVALSVSESNLRARTLYDHVGFKEFKRFYAFVRETGGQSNEA